MFILTHKLTFTDYGNQRTPWLITNLVFKNLPLGHDLQIAWDNVIFGKKSLGFVFSGNQSLKTVRRNAVLTHYYPLTDLKANRQMLLEMSDEELSRFSLDDLDQIFPDIKPYIDHIDFWIHGHGMCAPTPGRTSDYIKNTHSHSGNLIYCHTDRSGISIFEEAFDQGLQAFEHIKNLT